MGRSKNSNEAQMKKMLRKRDREKKKDEDKDDANNEKNKRKTGAVESNRTGAGGSAGPSKSSMNYMALVILTMAIVVPYGWWVGFLYIR